MADVPHALWLLASRLQQLIGERELSQADVARGIGKSPALITQLLNVLQDDPDKRISRVSLDTVDDLAVFLEVPPATFFIDPKTAPALTLRPIERDLIVALRKTDKNTRRALALILGLPAEKL